MRLANSPELILASASPRRSELMHHLGLKFTVLPSTIEEIIDSQLSPRQIVSQLALQKAMATANAHKLGVKTEKPLASQLPTIVIGADTIVVCNERILGKPSSEQEAVEMLSFLSNQLHQVYTGLALVVIGNHGRPEENLIDTEVSSVKFKPLVQEEIEAYIATKEPMDKAGSYALQGAGSAFVQRIEGCYTNVIGLPVPKLVQMLRQAGVTVLGLTGDREPVQ